MTTIAAAMVLLVLATKPALAEFKANEPPPAIEKWTPLECAILSRTATDRDPVYKIEVNLGLNDDGKIDTLYVVHSTVQGTTYDRSKQYKDANLWQAPNNPWEWYWKGERNGSVMVGKLYRTQNAKWFYTEKILRNGRQVYAMESSCHLVQGD